MCWCNMFNKCGSQIWIYGNIVFSIYLEFRIIYFFFRCEFSSCESICRIKYSSNSKLDLLFYGNSREESLYCSESIIVYYRENISSSRVEFLNDFSGFSRSNFSLMIFKICSRKIESSMWIDNISLLYFITRNDFTHISIINKVLSYVILIEIQIIIYEILSHNLLQFYILFL